MERNEAAEKGCLACSFPFWDKLTEAQQEYLCRFARPVRYEKGAHVHSPTENCVGILLLRSGQLRAYLLSEDGRDVTLYRLFAGDVCILSASCVLDAVTFDVHIDAEEPVEAYCIGAGAFKRVMDETGGTDLHMTHDQIARYMGSAREVVSRMLKYFAEEGLVKLWRGGLTVLDKPRLQKLARGETAGRGRKRA